MEKSHPNEWPRTAVVLPAAGTGTRMGGEKKQFRLLGDAPVIVQTVRAFERIAAVKEIIVVAPSDDLQETRELLGTYCLTAEVVEGGDTRQESVGNGLAAVSDESEIVLVHDAVRPFISAGQIQTIVREISASGAAGIAVPVADTLRKGEGGKFSHTTDRTGLFRMLTPQGASKELLDRAHREAVPDGFVGTDEVELLQRAGATVSLVLGDERNIKITRPSDWSLAEALWPSWIAEQLS